MASSDQRIILPRRLPPPHFHAIDPRVITAIDPELENIPLSYIQHILEDVGPGLLRATSNTTATPPVGRLPRELRVACNDVSVEPPSHIIAACRRDDTRVTLFPVHAIIIATSCSHLPALPRSKPDRPSAPGGSVTLPIVALCVPSPSTFHTLLSYLYTKRTDQLLTELLPASSSSSSIAQIMRAHASSLSVDGLIALLRKTYGLWGNMTALGISDDKLFRALEMAWEILLGALAVSSGQSVDAGVNVVNVDGLE